MFAELRDRCPVHHTMVPADHWTLSRERDVVDDETWSSTYGPVVMCWMLGMPREDISMFANMVNRLTHHPDQLALVQADRSVIPNVVEESLRIDAPVHGLFRTNNCPVTLHDVEIPEDSKVYMLSGSANRDPEASGDPDRFDITRDLKDLRRRHAAFGVGIHCCLGAALSRIEGAVALEAVLDRMRRIRPDGTPAKVKASVLNGYESLRSAGTETAGTETAG